MTFALGIPTINRYDLLKETLDKYYMEFPGTKIFIVDNGHQNITPHPQLIIIQPVSNLGVASSWNVLCNTIFMHGYDWAGILNDDVHWGVTKEQVIEFLTKHQGKGFITTTKDWCVFCLFHKTWQVVGPFDKKFFPAYFEDNDYAYRMQLAGITQHHNPFCDPLLYRRSQSLHHDKSLVANFMVNQQYYINKWGGLPGKERFKTPFNK